MSKKGGGKAGDAPAAPAYDPSALLSLYGMQYAGLGGLGSLGGLSGLAAAASSASSQNGTATITPSTSAMDTSSSSSTSAWYAMASQLAAQDYLTRLQAAARDPAAYAALAAQGVLPNYEMLTQGSKAAGGGGKGKKGRNSPAASSTSSRASAAASPSLDALRLPSDTEIIKYTSSSTGPKVPGTTNRGRKKTISLDPAPASSVASLAGSNPYGANLGALGVLLGAAASQGDLATSAVGSNGSSAATDGSPPSIPPGLTIERKKPGRKPMDPDNHITSSGPTVDRVEITKVPVNASLAATSGLGNGRSNSPSVSITTRDFPSSSLSLSGGALSLSSDSATITPSGSGAGKIPSDYYASQALSGVFLAEQIRQQQLAAALESRLSESGKAATTSTASPTDLMQAALLMNRLKEQQSGGSLAASDTSKLLAIAAAAAAASNADQSSASSTWSKTLGKSNKKVPPKKNTVASLLEQAKGLGSDGLAERVTQNPELTIEPLFKSFQPDKSFDPGLNGANSSGLKIKMVNDSPEIRNLSDQEAREALLRGGGGDLDSDHATRASLGRYATVETAELRIPLECGWKRETLVREYSKSGVRGDVVYYAPCGKKFKQYPDIVRHLEKNGMNNLTRDHFSFSTKIFIGEFLKPTGQRGDDGEEKYLRLNEHEMLDDVEKIRKENGWKPLKRSLPPPPSTTSPVSGASTPNVYSQPPAKRANLSPSPTPPPSASTPNSAQAAAAAAMLSSLLPSMTPEQKIMARLQAEMQIREQQAQREEELRLQKEALRYIREAERLEKLEQARREKEARQREQAEAKRRRQEEARQRQEENLKRLQEKELKRQQAALVKEQTTSGSTIDMGSLYQAAMERERRRQHMLLMKALEGKKRYDEREKRREDLRVEKERERERRIEQKKLENEIVAEMRKPVEDMCLPQEDDGTEEGKRHALPKLPRIPELLLSGEAFANVLMVYEFLHNFGERLGFDMESLPSMNDLQAALLNDPEAEEELLSVVIHLLVCAIDDPGIPTPHKHLTLLGQNLRQADITNTNVSEILKIYLTARGQLEVKNLHGVTPPETHSAKDRSREIPFCQKKMEEFNRLLKTTRAWEMAQWVKDRPFLCLNPTEKAEILAFVCNELLFNKSVMHQIESNVEKVNKAKKIRLIAETRLRKLKHIQARKIRLSHIITPNKPDVTTDCSASQSHVGGDDNADKGSEMASNAGDAEKSQDQAEEDEDDDKESVKSESAASESNQTPVKKKRGRPRKYGKTKYTKKKKRKVPEPEPEPEPEEEPEPEPEESEEEDLDDLENEEDMNEEELDKLNAEEITKKVDRASRQAVKSRDDLVHISNCLRVNDLGQDRFRRRYWHFAHAGGVFVEGMESCEPWKLEHKGMPHETDKLFDKKRREEEEEEDEEEEEEEEPEAKKPKVEEVKKETEEEVIEEVKEKESSAEDKQKMETEEALKKLGNEILVTPKVEEKSKPNPAVTPKITPNGDKLNLFNHSAHFNMTLSPVVLNGSVTITPKNEPNAFSTSSPMVGGTAAPQQQTALPPSDKPWFSLLPTASKTVAAPPSSAMNGESNNNHPSKDHSARFAEFRREKALSDSPDKTAALLGSIQNPVNPQIALLELRLKELRKTNFNKERKAVPDELCRGWWRIEDIPTMVALERALNMRGAREQLLLQNSKRSLDFMHEMVMPGVNSLDVSAAPSGTATPTTDKPTVNSGVATPKPKPLGEPLGLEPLDEIDDIKILECGVPAPDVPGNWSWEVALRCDKYILEQVEALEDKVAAASMQVPGWKIPDRPDIDDRDFRPSCCPPDKGDDRPDPISEARERLLELEAAIERRYLKAPLGHSNAEINLQTITSSSVKPSGNSSTRRTTNTSLNISKELAHDGSDIANGEDEDSRQTNGDLNESHDDDDGDDDGGKRKEKSHLPRGLIAWREGVRKAQTAAQLAMGFYVLETSIAWHKSIMKAFCQLCHNGDDEDSLLLCDGCDKGYHTYCFKPAMTTVPDGDWYCFECINKATGIRHCLVCGKQDGKHLVPCTSCPRAYHTECLSPALSKVPRGKWQCPGCNQKTKIPKRKIPKKLKIIVGPPDTDDVTPSASNASVNSDTNASKEDGRKEAKAANSKASKKEEKEKEKEKEVEEKVEENHDEEEKEEEQKEEEEREPSPEPPPEKKSRKEYKKRSKEPKEQQPSKTERDLKPCKILIEEMASSEDSWPFLFPVNAKQFPTYRKIIKRPMDIASIKKKLEGGAYKTREEFCDDVRLIFANCEVFNEDDSPVGKAGHAMRHLFDTRWVELIGQEAKGGGGGAAK